MPQSDIHAMSGRTSLIIYDSDIRAEMKNISVVVPVYNDWDMVPSLINALESQMIPSEEFELILVDNGSDVNFMDRSLPSWARVIECTTPGSYAARNAGVGVAVGQLIVFTDADCIPEPQWLAQGWKAWSDAGGKCLVAGGVRIEPQNPDAMTISEMFDVVHGLPQQRYVRNGYAVTANLMVSREIFGDVGLFNANRFSGGDAEFCRRATARGWGLLYCDGARVLHPARRELKALTTKRRRVLGGQLKFGSPLQRPKYAIRATTPPLRAWVRTLRSDRLSLRQRLRVCGVIALLTLVEIKEMIRLIFGGTPERR